MTLHVHQVSKTFPSERGAVEALRSVSFAVGRGESVAVVGRNGAGKSTLLHMVAGVLAPTAGRIRRPSRTVSILDLGTGLHPDLTGEENLEVALALTRAQGLADPDPAEIVGFAELRDELRRPVKHYSDGMKARLSSAIALCSDPDLLLLDEVLAVGDASFQRKVVDRADELIAKGTTVLLATHSVELARWARRCLWLDRGELVRDGPSGPVLDEYEVTSGTPRRRSSDPEARIGRVVVDPGSVEPGGPLRVEVTVDVARPSSDLAVRIDLRPTAGDEVWMRPRDESPEQRDLNLLATTPDHRLGRLDPGAYVIGAELPALPITSSLLELSVVVFDGGGEVHDEMSADLAVGRQPDRPRVEMSLLRGPAQ